MTTCLSTGWFVAHDNVSFGWLVCIPAAYVTYYYCYYRIIIIIIIINNIITLIITGIIIITVLLMYCYYYYNPAAALPRKSHSHTRMHTCRGVAQLR